MQAALAYKEMCFSASDFSNILIEIIPCGEMLMLILLQYT